MNHINNIKNIEKEMVAFLSLAIKQPIKDNDLINHPIRFAEASKSLIGLNLKKPNLNILNFINTFKFESKNDKKEVSQSIFETVSIYQLEDSILNGSTHDIPKILDSLLQLSDGRHILEFLIEISLGKSEKSLILIWAIYKSMNFIGYNDRYIVKNALEVACEALVVDDNQLPFSKETIDLKEIDFQLIHSDRDLHVLGVIYEIYNFDFIRKDLIQNKLSNFIGFFYQKIKDIETKNHKSNSGIFIDIKSYDILDAIDNASITSDSLLSFNAIRILKRNSVHSCARDIGPLLQFLPGVAD